MPCPYCDGENLRGKEAVTAIDVAESRQDDAQVYFSTVIVFYIR
jgi:hypothetical protein